MDKTMSMSRKTSYPPGSTKADIRRLFVIVMPFMWCISLRMGLGSGTTVPQAISTATFASLAGFANWCAYHFVSRHNNGVMMVMFPSMSLTNRPYISYWPTFCYLFLVWVIVGCFSGLTARVFVREKRDPDLSEPMYDTQIDRPAEAIAR